MELNDGTQVSLNANSRVVVQYDDQVRKVTLTRGEALFNVIKHQLRPFVVIVGDRKVVAMGTSSRCVARIPPGPPLRSRWSKAGSPSNPFPGPTHCRANQSRD